MKNILFFLAVPLVAAACAVASSTATEQPLDRTAQLQRGLDHLVAAGAPGAVLFVREHGRTIRLTSGYGNLKTKTKIRPGDRFRVGSITKPFVATVALQLVAEGKLSLDDTVERWQPGLVPNGANITVRQLLNHTAGLFDYGGDDKFLEAAFRYPMKQWPPRQIVKIATSHKPYFAPGTSWAYANTNYYVLGLIVVASSRNSLPSEIRNRIIEPLKLRATNFDTAPRIAGPHARGYFLKPLEDVTDGSPSVFWASGALTSNADDLTTFFHALLGGRLLRPDLLREMETMVPESFVVTEKAFSYGLGLLKQPLTCGAVWGHSGGAPGYVTGAFNNKQGTRQVVLLVNGSAMLGSGQFRSFALPKKADRAYTALLEKAYCR
jgi:D-alanyl-D-alanine carboxypeptidase